MTDERETEEIAFDQMPREAIEYVKRHVANFSVGLVWMGAARGSGVLVKAQGIYGIITASHVVHGQPRSDRPGTEKMNLKKDSRQLLQMPIDNREGKAEGFGIPCGAIEEISIGAPTDGDYKESGPDITFLRIGGGEYVSTLNATKSFYNLDCNSSTTVEPSLTGNAIFSGYAASLVERRDTPKGEAMRMQELQLYGRFEPNSYRRSDGFDYMTVAIDTRENPKMPTNFGGVSGGPVWQFGLLRRKSDGAFAVQGIRLAGIVFYQGDLSDGCRPLICHLHESISVATTRIIKLAS